MSASAGQPQALLSRWLSAPAAARVVLLALVVCFAPVAYGAAGEQPEDFAYGLSVATQPGQPLHELALPIEVYQHLRRADLGDLRVFNAAGKPVPHGTAELAPAPDARRVATLAAFGVDLPHGGDVQRFELDIERDARGVIRKLRARDAPAGAVRRAFIIPLDALARPITGLRLKWRRPPGNFVLNARLDVSDDLEAWTPLVGSWLVAHLKRGARSLRHDYLALEPLHTRYLRIRFDGDAAVPEITGAVAEPLPDEQAPALHWMTREPIPDPEQARRYLFDLPPGLLMRKLQVLAPQPNTYSTVRLRRRAATDRPWNSGSTTPVYHLEFPEGTLRNDPLPVSGGSMRYWAIEVDAEGGGLGGSPPGVRIGWRPHLLVFIARGQGPFTVAYGSAHAPSVVRPAAAILQDLGRSPRPKAGSFGLPVATILGPVDLAGGDALVPRRPPPDWKRIVLWVVLVAGVAVLAFMAWSLLRETGSVVDAGQTDPAAPATGFEPADAGAPPVAAPEPAGSQDAGPSGRI